MSQREWFSNHFSSFLQLLTPYSVGTPLLLLCLCGHNKRADWYPLSNHNVGMFPNADSLVCCWMRFINWRNRDVVQHLIQGKCPHTSWVNLSDLIYFGVFLKPCCLLCCQSRGQSPLKPVVKVRQKLIFGPVTINRPLAKSIFCDLYFSVPLMKNRSYEQ